jgi:hypothetical protein
MEQAGYTRRDCLMNVKAHLVLPREILEEVDRIAGKKKRSLFIAEAAREKIEKERFLKILEETHGAWGDDNHPELRSPKDMERYLRRTRQSYRKRLKEIVS